MDVNDEPADNHSKLADVLRQLVDDGYDGQLIALGEGEVLCTACDKQIDANQVTVDGVRYTEVANDSDESRIVIWARCPLCAHRIVAVLGYGPAANPADQTALDRFDLDHPIETDNEPNRSTRRTNT